MDYSILLKGNLFKGISEEDISNILINTPHHIRDYSKGEIIFHIAQRAELVGIILKGKVEAQKNFPNGSQVDVSMRTPGDLIGPAAVFSKGRKYPCDIVALGPVSIMMFSREALLKLMQSNIRILENFTTEISTATYMLQQSLELLSYNGIAQKAAFWLLMQAGRLGKNTVTIPESISKWAMLMNVSRPSLHRELSRLEKEEIISYTPPVIDILNPAALQNLLNK